MTDDDWISTAEAAQLLNLEFSGNVRTLITDGKLKATKRGRDWWLRRADVEAYAARRRPRGRPKSSEKLAREAAQEGE